MNPFSLVFVVLLALLIVVSLVLTTRGRNADDTPIPCNECGAHNVPTRLCRYQEITPFRKTSFVGHLCEKCERTKQAAPTSKDE